MGFATDAIHVGQEPDPATGAIVAPIYQTSTYVQEELGKNKGFDYARTNHPNRKALERRWRKLEGGHAAYVFTSGMAAIDSVFRLLRPGDHAIISEAVYGGVYPADDPTSRAIRSGIQFCGYFLAGGGAGGHAPTRECCTSRRPPIRRCASPTSPPWPRLPLSAMPPLVVDNTFLSSLSAEPDRAWRAHRGPFHDQVFERPQRLHRAAAWLLTRPEDAEKIYFLQRSAGAGLAPMDCFLVSRGIKTLAVRMMQHNANGIAVARHLEAHAKVRKVYYPGLASHPQHDIARKQQRGFGAMISFDLGSLEAARRFLNQVKICSLAESLGGVESLISLPATMTHASMPEEVRERIGITEGLVRLSVGIEDVEDIIDDLDQALLYV